MHPRHQLLSTFHQYCHFRWRCGLIFNRPVPYSKLFDQKLYDIFRQCQIRRIPIGVFSVGGCGSKQPIPDYKFELLKYATRGCVTVRSKEDKAYLDTNGVYSEYYPDVVFAAKYELEGSGENAARTKTVINVDKYSGRLIHLLLATLYNQRVDFNDIVFVRTHNTDAPHNYEYYPAFSQCKLSNIESYAIEDPLEALKQMGMWKRLYSTKLHLGVAALSMGVEFYCFGGKGKIRLMAKDMSIEQYMAFGRLGLIRSILATIGKDNEYIVPKLKQKTEDALGHYVALANFLSHCLKHP